MQDATDPTEPTEPTDPTGPDPADRTHGAGVVPEPHHHTMASRLNWLRAGVLGANDGIVSTAGLVVGVAGATTDTGTLLLTGLAGLVAGSLSMAGGEYVSVSTQRDSEQAMLELERWELRELPEVELEELADLYRDRGLAPDLAREVAEQLTEHDALAAHAEVELGIDPDELTSPWHAAWSSMVAFAAGALLPLLAIVLPPPSTRVAITAVSSALALALTGLVSARIGRSAIGPAITRNVVTGVLAMGVTFAVGSWVGADLV